MQDQNGKEIRLGSYLIIATEGGVRFGRVMKQVSQIRYGAETHSMRVKVIRPGSQDMRSYMQTYTISLRRPDKTMLANPDFFSAADVALLR